MKKLTKFQTVFVQKEMLYLFKQEKFYLELLVHVPLPILSQ